MMVLMIPLRNFEKKKKKKMSVLDEASLAENGWAGPEKACTLYGFRFCVGGLASSRLPFIEHLTSPQLVLKECVAAIKSPPPPPCLYHSERLYFLVL